MKNNILSNSINLKDCENFWSNLENLSDKYDYPSDWASDTGYGSIDIYKDYAGLEEKYKPKVNVIHGLFMGMKKKWWIQSEAGFKALPSMIVHYETSRVFLNKLFNNKKKFYAIQHPYHIILKNYKEFKLDPKGGSVFFLPHSIGYGEIFSPSYLLRYLKNLSDKYYPIKICVHPADINKEFLKLFQTSKFEIVCCGKRYDPLFLHRFFWLTNGIKYCLSVDFATQVFLSSVSGLEIIPLNNKIPMMNWRHGNQAIYFDKPDEEYWDILEAFFTNQIDQNSFKDKCNFVTGKHLNLNSKDVLEIFKNSEKQYFSFKWDSLKYKFWSIFEPYQIKFRSYFKAIQNRLSGNNRIIQPWSADLFYRLYKYHKSFK